MDRLVAVGNWLGDGEHPGLHAGPRRASKEREKYQNKIEEEKKTTMAGVEEGE